MTTNQDEFYELAAKRFAAATNLYHVDAVVHVENRADIWFWKQALNQFSSKKYEFLCASMNEKGNRTSGCEQCLKYKNHLSSKFFICIDSDLRYLSDELATGLNGILLTYTYSWENHCAFANRLQTSFARQNKTGKVFDFVKFLSGYSNIVYEPLLLVLSGKSSYSVHDLWRCITLQYRTNDETNNGQSLLDRMQQNLAKYHAQIITDEQWEAMKKHYSEKGLTESTAYLYVKGHCVYNTLLSVGNQLCKGTGVNFEEQVLKESLAFGSYAEISKVENDIRSWCV